MTSGCLPGKQFAALILTHKVMYASTFLVEITSFPILNNHFPQVAFLICFEVCIPYSFEHLKHLFIICAIHFNFLFLRLHMEVVSLVAVLY